ncbi:LuxR family transcriptional regulator [Kribbella sancticallisti]|uniref:LuxR family transcriptional regulator n=1 Tax=Kribbella sancticallisti TaxID=460087 RepID=A0ABN2DHR7_9ACTN
MTVDDTRAAGRTASALVGRADQLRRLVAAVSGPPAVVVVEGEAGIGKTRLVAEMSARARQADRLVLTGACRRIREPFPLGPIVEALRGTSEHLAATGLSPVAGALRGLLPELAQVLPPALEPLDDRAAERHRVFRGLAEVLGLLGPVLVIEDLHWADEQTVEFLAYLQSVLPVSVSVVLTYRGEEADAGVRDTTRRPAHHVFHDHLVLDALDAEQTRAMAASILDEDGVTTEFGNHLYELSSGLPLAVQELLALLRERGALIRLRSGRWARKSLDELDVPPGVRDSVRERVGRLPAAAQGVAEAAAVLQVPVPVPVLMSVARLPRDQLVTGLDELLISGLLAEREGEVAFRHVLAAQAVYSGIQLGRRQELHARAASAVQAVEPEPLGQRAHHLRQAGHLHEWVDVAVRAAEQASALGDDAEAVRNLEDVLRNAPLEPDRRGRLAAQLGWAACQVLRPPAVIDVITQALSSAQPGTLRGELHFLVGVLQERHGDDPSIQRRAFAAAVDDLGDRPDLAAWVMAALGRPMDPAVPVAEHTQWLDRALEAVPAIGDPVEEVFVLGKVAMSQSAIGDPRWSGLTEDIRRRTGGRPRHRQEVSAYRSIAENAFCAGHYRLADQLLSEASQAAAGDDWSGEPLARCRLVGLLLAFGRGRWAGLGQEVATLLEEYDGRPFDRTIAETVAACLALVHGDLDAARRDLPDVANRTLMLGGYELLPISVTGLLRLSTAQGEAQAALAAVRDAVDLWEVKGLWPVAVRMVPAWIEAMIAVGRQGEATEFLAGLSATLTGLDAPFAAAVMPHARGQLAADPLDAATRFLAAAAGYDRLEAPYEAAQVREQAAYRLFAAGDPSAGEALRAALAAFQEMGARWDLDRAAQVARRHGVTVKGRYPGGPHGYGSALSPRELEVAELAAAGLTNREIGRELFLSAKTVEKHVSAVLRKLGLRSRSALGSHLSPHREEL